MIFSRPQTKHKQRSGAALPLYRYVQNVFLAAGIGLAPVTLTLYATLAPFLRGNGSTAIAANLAANPLTNQLHLVFGVATGFLLPIGSLGMAVLTYKRAPWLATLGGILGLVGWLPWSPLMALEALTYDMAQMGGGPQFAALWDRFNADAVMTFYLLFYIVCHLISVVLLGLALWRAQVVPAWSAWALVLTSPLTIIAFPTRSSIVFDLVYVLFLLGSLPAAYAMLKFRWQEEPTRTAGESASTT
jgi:hypothetical protein